MVIISSTLNLPSIFKTRAPTPSSAPQEASGPPHPPPPSADSVTAGTKLVQLFCQSKYEQHSAQRDFCLILIKTEFLDVTFGGKLLDVFAGWDLSCLNISVDFTNIYVTKKSCNMTCCVLWSHKNHWNIWRRNRQRLPGQWWQWWEWEWGWPLPARSPSTPRSCLASLLPRCNVGSIDI